MSPRRHRRWCRSQPGDPRLVRRRGAAFSRGTAPNIATEMVIGPGVRSVSPPNSGQSKDRRPHRGRGRRRKPRVPDLFRQRECEQKPQRPCALRREIGKVTRKAFLPTVSGGSSAKKCTPPMMPSVLSTMSQPAGGSMTAASSKAKGAGMFRQRPEIDARSGGPRDPDPAHATCGTSPLDGCHAESTGAISLRPYSLPKHARTFDGGFIRPA